MKLLEFIESIPSYKKKGKGDLLKFAGAIGQSELQLMKDVIAEGCENIETRKIKK